MSCSTSSKLRDRWPSVIVAGALAALIVLAHSAQSGSPAQPSGADGNKAWREYAEACVKLAEADLAVTESQNRKFKKSAAEFELQRLHLHRDFVEKATSVVTQGGDYGDVIARYAELQAQLAELEVKAAAEARRKDPTSVSDEVYERLRRNADVYRLQIAIVREPSGALSMIDHLHWETHRLAADVMLLNRRVEWLEEKISHR